ncbi:MAG: beta-phosphoglucomutase [Saprospiraceae bacterium]|nr:beta-phosphoglucomutase [Saprospiraceae bacterium]MBP7699275.1 beta-phosphoglucomutase [Saprospiraceae bacterium]
MLQIDAFIFDLDGVIVDTAKYHYLAWKRLANELGFDLTPENNEKLKGVSRIESLNTILKWGKLKVDDSTKSELAEKKNAWYLEYISTMGREEILPGVEEFINEARKQKIRLAVASASKNTLPILENLALKDYFEFIADGNMISKSKPDPEIFQLVAKTMELSPPGCVVFEDAASGISAALAANMFAVGVGKPEHLTRANFVIADFEFLTYQEILEMITSYSD